MISPYLMRRLRSIEEVLAANEARVFGSGDVRGMPRLSGRFAALDPARDREVDGAVELPRRTPPQRS